MPAGASYPVIPADDATLPVEHHDADVERVKN
jgi:hypothetical protein